VESKGFAMLGVADFVGFSTFLLEKKQQKITSWDLKQISALKP
jgi:hypothetical protein